MIIIETCPKCGHDLLDVLLTTYPAIPKKECPSCGWSWTGQREEIVRVPFGGNAVVVKNDHSLNENYGYSINKVIYDEFVNTACNSCPSNPKNGGSGICNCTLGQIDIT